MIKWQNIKFWLWLEVTFPDPMNCDDPGPQGFQAPQGIQGPQGAQEPTPAYCSNNLIGTNVCFDILSYADTFEINAIPSASVTVALGRRGDDVSILSDIHYRINELKLQLPAKVWCLAGTLGASADLDDYPGRLWPPDKFKVFEGYLTGSGFRRSSTGAELVLSITHWLTDLNFSSAVSKQSHPLNPSQLYYPANFVLSNVFSSGGDFMTGVSPSLTGARLAGPFFNDPNVILRDFWGGIPDTDNNFLIRGMKNWLLTLTQLDRINRGQILILSSGGLLASNLRPEINWEACRALMRFEPDAVVPEAGIEETGYFLGVPLGMFSNVDLNGFVAKAIAEEMGNETLDAYHQTTLWDKLTGNFHTNYMFSVIPLVEKALIVPFMPGLNSTDDVLVHRVIRTSQYESIELSAAMPRPLRAVGIIIGKNFGAGGHLALEQQPQIKSFGGWFDKMTRTSDTGSCVDPRYKEGMILLREGPNWMSNVIGFAGFTSTSTGVGSTIATNVSPTAGNSAPAVPRDLFGFLQDPNAHWNAYAHAVYIHEILKGRQGTITGPVRFDIAPGSQIKVEVSEDKYVREILNPDDIANCSLTTYNFIYCSVLRVSTVIDCQNTKASTSYYVGHVRDENENRDPGTSINKHPIWQRCQWGGCVLIQDDAFAPLATKDVGCDSA